MSVNMLIASVKDVSEAERANSRIWWQDPIVPFIPSKSLELVPKDHFLEVTLRVNPKTKASKVNSLKRSVLKFSSGTIEELLKWKTELDDVINGIPIDQVTGKLNMAEQMLMEDSLAKFKEIREKVCHSVDTDSNELLPLGECDQAFELVMKKFIIHHFPQANSSPSGRQKKYMRSFLRKPRTVLVKKVVSRLQQMNAMLPLFPGPENFKFSEGELVDLVCNMMPQKWLQNLVQMDVEPCECTLDQIQNALEKIELLEQQAEANEKAKPGQRKAWEEVPKKPNLKFKKLRFKAEANGKPGPKGNGKSCSVCLALGRVSHNHTDRDCFIKKQYQKRGNEGKPKAHKAKPAFNGKELNALVEKKVRALLKKQLAKAGLDPVETSSGSDQSMSE